MENIKRRSSIRRSWKEGNPIKISYSYKQLLVTPVNIVLLFVRFPLIKDFIRFIHMFCNKIHKFWKSRVLCESLWTCNYEEIASWLERVEFMKFKQGKFILGKIPENYNVIGEFPLFSSEERTENIKLETKLVCDEVKVEKFVRLFKILFSNGKCSCFD